MMAFVFSLCHDQSYVSKKVKLDLLDFCYLNSLMGEIQRLLPVYNKILFKIVC